MSQQSIERRLEEFEHWRARREADELSAYRVLFAQTANVTVANTTAETTLVGSGVGSLALPANFFVPGRVVRVTAQGAIGYTATPTIVLRIYFGSTNIGGTTTLTLTGATALNVWRLDGFFTLLTAGATGTIHGMMAAEWWKTLTGENQASGGTSLATVIDTTAATTLDLKAQWGTANALNTITCYSLVVEALN